MPIEHPDNVKREILGLPPKQWWKRLFWKPEPIWINPLENPDQNRVLRRDLRTRTFVLRFFAVLILLAVVAGSATVALAGTAFLKYERISGLNKICVYDYLGSEYAITIKSVELCPLTIEVD